MPARPADQAVTTLKPWSDEQREAAHDLFHALDDADTTDGCPQEVVCAEIAKIAHLFRAPGAVETPSQTP